MKHPRSKKSQLITILGILVSALLASYLMIALHDRVAAPAYQPEPVQDAVTPEITEEEPEQVEVQKPVTAISTWPVALNDEQASSLTVVVNKKHRLPPDYVPTLKSVSGGQMRPEAADALAQLLTGADAAGLSIKIVSSYRSYSTQTSVYNNYVKQHGQAEADTFSARPGHSEHQTGLAVDLGNTNGSCQLETCFGDSAAGQWLAAHAQDYGFIIRYEKGKDAITGYQYEPWHLRFVGVSVAKAVVALGKTLDEYYGVPAGDYQ
ncbi:MAG: M15 family metallopeptidase [Candidatus Saccharibacteria bacterium]|nr:M15 family metallopeptidase [Candidatus Saccharibacteria bacterium]